MKDQWRVILQAIQPGTEGFRRFLNLLGEWYTETNGGTRPNKDLTVVSDGNNAQMKRNLKEWGCPIRLLPAVKNFRIELGSLDKLFLAFGHKRRIPEKMTFEAYRANLSINRYLWYQAKRLHEKRSQPKVFWTIAKQLLKSRAYAIAGLNHILHGWHRKHPYWKVVKVLIQLRALQQRGATEAQLKRCYIPKAKGVRPLGVPSPAWRIYSHMWQNIITMFFLPVMSPSQHGFLPGRGLMTAWAEVLKVVEKSRYVYEYDLKKFFDSVTIDYVHKVMRLYEIPKPICAEIRKINRTITQLQVDDQIEEPDRQVTFTADLQLNPNWDKTLSVEQQFPGGRKDMPKFLELVLKNIGAIPRSAGTTMTPNELLRKQQTKALETDGLWASPVTKAGTGWREHGMPQGMPTSPILSIVALNECFTKVKKNQVAYADDFILYGNTPGQCRIGSGEAEPIGPIRWKYFPSSGCWDWKPLNPPILKGLKEANVQINWDKSGWVKYDGYWLKPLKFLGMEFDGNNYKAKTRNGATLEFGDLEALLAYLRNRQQTEERKSISTSGHLWATELKDTAQNLSNLSRELLIKYLSSSSGISPLDLASLPEGLRRLINEARTSRGNWEQWLKSDVKGYFLSRMQSDSWETNIVQDFTLKYLQTSWMRLRSSRWAKAVNYDIKEATVFNSSSFASHSLLHHLVFLESHARKLARRRRKGLPLIRRVKAKSKSKS